MGGQQGVAAGQIVAAGSKRNRCPKLADRPARAATSRH